MNRVVFIVIDATSLRRDQYGRMVAKTTDGIDVTVSLPAGEVFERYESELPFISMVTLSLSL